ncbi:MAG TPA: hypothetical protein VIM55_16135 [Mucilaginibacter sp.]
MKKVIAMLALAAFCTASFAMPAPHAVPAKMQQDTVKKKVKKKGNKMKMKKKMKDTTKQG